MIENYCLSILAKIDELCIDVAEINERTKHLAIKDKGHEAVTPSSESQNKLDNESNLSKESKRISTSNSTYSQRVETVTVNADSLISRIKTDPYWREFQLIDEELTASIYPRLVDCVEVRNDSRVISSHKMSVLSNKAIETFIRQLNKMKEDGLLDCFFINPEETCFI